MTKIKLLFATLFFPVLFGCSDNHNDIWDSIDNLTSRVDALEQKTEQINDELTALGTLVNALKNNVSITSVESTSAGYRFRLSDGSVINIHHGTDGKDGLNGSNGADGINAPEISVVLDAGDGNYYWTLNGEWLTVNGQRVKANGVDGKDGMNGLDGNDGKEAVAPRVRINPSTKEWEISTDNGLSWQSTGVVAEGKNGSDGTNGSQGDSMFSKIDIQDEYVEFTLSNGQTFKLMVYAVVFNITDDDDNDISETVQEFGCQSAVTYKVEARNIIDYSIKAPKGWTADYNDKTGELTVAAPDKITGTDNDKEGTVVISLAVQSQSRALEMVQSAVYKFDVKVTYELRVLTFEDVDVKFDPYEMEFNGSTFHIEKWSDLIDDPQYGGPMLYGEDFDNMTLSSTPYWWYDENNTELKHEMPEAYGSYCFWSGGHAISNYAATDIDATGDYLNQLTIYGEQGSAGHDGSENFAVQFGYLDSSGYTVWESVSALTFADGEHRVIDHMWVMPNNYALFCYANGNSLTSAMGPDDFVKIVAYGYDNEDDEYENYCSSTEIFIAEGENFMKEWTKFDLSVLGEVTMVRFNIIGSSDNGYGFSQPAYFAYDDVAVRFKLD